MEQESVGQSNDAPEEADNAAQVEEEPRAEAISAPNDDGQQAEHADFVEYLNERFCGFTGS
jgi:hypothetical protein